MDPKRTILLIDDEVDFLDMMKFILENANYNVLTASVPQEGIKKSYLTPDLILLDLNMPGMSGHEVCRKIKEDLSTTNIPIIMLTCQDKTLDKVQAFNLGVIDYINKQASYDEILARIKSVIKRTQPQEVSLSQQEKHEKIMLLRKIIEGKDIRTLFQPIVKLSNLQPYGYEALARGPKGTFLENPLNLFALANEANMSYELDTLCMDLAVKRAEKFIKGSLLFLNADASVINSEYLKTLTFLKDSTIPANQICIEVTERIFVTNFTRLADNLKTLKPMGVMIVIDDLGEGYSSLKAIAELRPEFIKIDMSLVRNVHTDIIKQSLIQVICDLSKKVSSRLIAEGIETEEEYKTIHALGVELGQGYLFARPSEFTQ